MKKQQIRNIMQFCLLFGLFVVFMAGTAYAGTPGTAIRTLPVSYTPGTPLNISIDVTPLSITTVWGISENFPSGWTPSNVDCVIITTGVHCTTNEMVVTPNDIEWAIVQSDTTAERILSYTVLPPVETTGQKIFSGQFLYYTGTFYNTISVSGNNIISRFPIISNIIVYPITLTGATINWNTDLISDTQVEYGTTINYGSTTILNSSLVTTHSQILNGLSNGTVYHYRVKSRDSLGNLSVSPDETFSTFNPIHPADIQTNWDINFSEYLAYANCWKSGNLCNWRGTGIISYDYYLNALNIWFVGQIYHYTLSTCILNQPNTCWIPGN